MICALDDVQCSSQGFLLEFWEFFIEQLTIAFEITGYHVHQISTYSNQNIRKRQKLSFTLGLKFLQTAPLPPPPPPSRRSGHGGRLNLILLRRSPTIVQRGEFHISHDASLHTVLSSFRTHVILSVFSSSSTER